MIRQYLSDIINNHKTQGEWKIQLTTEINFISSKDSNEIRTMYTTSDNIEIMIGIMKQMRSLKIFLNLSCKNIKKN